MNSPKCYINYPSKEYKNTNPYHSIKPLNFFKAYYNFEELLKASQNDSKVEVILVNPLMAFVFWEISEDKKDVAHKCSKRNNLFLRVHEKRLDDGSESYFDIPVKSEDSKWYITLPSNGCQYYIDLMMRNPDDIVIATSNKIDSPRKIIKDIVNNESMFRDDFLVLAGVYGFYDDDGSGDNTQKIVSFLNTGSIGEGE